MKNQQMTHRQHAASRRIPDVPRPAVRTQELDRSFLFAGLQEFLPLFRDYRPGCRLREIFERAADYLVARYAEKSACANTGILILPVVVCEKYRDGWMEDDGFKQPLKFFRAVFGEPSCRLRTRGCGGQDSGLLSPSIPEAAIWRTTYSSANSGKPRMAVLLQSST